MAASPEERKAFIDAAKVDHGPEVTQLSRPQVFETVAKHKLPVPWWLIAGDAHKVSRGVYSFARQTPPLASGKGARRSKSIMPAPAMIQTVAVAGPTESANTAADNLADDGGTGTMVHHVSLVPEKFQGYVPFGNYKDIAGIIASKRFYPIYLTGETGNGKTMIPEQACANMDREMIRVNVIAETDEDDLIGGFRLQDGKTVWHNGPVVVAMERGAVLLLDEVDLGSSKLMCLQPVLEGRPIFIKKINKIVHPQPGFTVVATANTKGRGNDNGRFIGTNIMNEAFLDRFSITMEQDYPTPKIETQILTHVLKKEGTWDDQGEEFVNILTEWADLVRKTYKDGGVSELISTRRLVDICKAYSIFGLDRMKALTLCLARFDTESRDSFIKFYTRIDAKVTAPAAAPKTSGVNKTTDDPLAF